MRPAAVEDITLLMVLMTEFYAEAGTPLNATRAAAAFAALLADERLGNVWLIQADKKDVGYVVVTFSYSMEFAGRNAFLDDLFIERAFRGAGLGTAALAEVRAFAWSAACAPFIWKPGGTMLRRRPFIGAPVLWSRTGSF